jgi:hypothetical protein
MSKKVIEGDVDFKELVLFSVPDILRDIDEVQGFLRLSYNRLKSLEGCPQKILGSFRCDMNTELNSLQGGPQFVGHTFDCGATSIKNLIGCPQKVLKLFDCAYNVTLVSLEGCPRIIDGNFNCSYCNNLQSFEGGPEIIKGDVTFIQSRDAKPLLSLKGFPKVVEGDFYADDKSEAFPFTEQEVRAICEIKGMFYKTVWK